MKVAVTGSRGSTVKNLRKYLPPETTEIVSGGARGIDANAREYALSHKINILNLSRDIVCTAKKRRWFATTRLSLTRIRF